jgi:hypothetical protein
MIHSFSIPTIIIIALLNAAVDIVGQEPSKTDSLLPSTTVIANADDTLSTADSILSSDSTEEGWESEDTLELTEEIADTLPVTNADSAFPSEAKMFFQHPTDTLKEPGRKLYPGISVQQDSLAMEVIQKIWLFDWDGVEKFSRKMQKLERKEQLPPLSYLLMVSSCIVHMQNGGFSNKRGEKKCLAEAEKYAKTGLTLSDPSKSPDSLASTMLFIHGGIKGILAILQISRSPVNAGMEGLSALGLLEKSLVLTPSNNDVYLGLGIFYCALAKASPIVRGALNLIGRPVSLEKGLSYLRRSASLGRYTAAMAKFYLIQFLSPYLGDQAAEKSRIFKSLETSFPANPCFLFLKLEENLCFHPEKAFDPSIRRTVRKKIALFDNDEYSRARFANLVRWQYLLIDPFASSIVHPDTTFDLQEFSYYPAFLYALREKYLFSEWEKATPSIRQRRLALIKKKESRILKLLKASSMSASWRGFFAWHVRDALRIEN